MQSFRLYQSEMNKLNHKINSMQHYINQLNSYVAGLNIYEYHIQGMKIEKVSGALQIGQLIEQDVEANDGIHRFFIGEIKITEIEGTGTVGIGVTEKGESNKKEDKKIPPEEANEETKQIYNEIEQVLGIGQVPIFFQKLAVQGTVLKTVWQAINKEWNSSTEFDRFYEEILKRLNEIPLPDVTPSIQKVDNDICKNLVDSMEEQAKTLLIIVFLLQSLLPGYLTKHKINVSPEKLKIFVQKPNEQISTKEILTNIKEVFHLKELPSSFDKLKEFPEILRNVYFSIIRPVVETENANQFYKFIGELFIIKAEKMSEDLKLHELSVEEQGFLYAQLIENLKRYQTFILLEYLVLSMCES